MRPIPKRAARQPPTRREGPQQVLQEAAVGDDCDVLLRARHHRLQEAHRARPQLLLGFAHVGLPQGVGFGVDEREVDGGEEGAVVGGGAALVAGVHPQDLPEAVCAAVCVVVVVCGKAVYGVCGGKLCKGQGE
jgi:hypothetical protein